MDIKNFQIGKKFIAGAGFEWLCTDKGTRTITAIMLDKNKDNSWFVGPPYSVKEVVFDEIQMKRCYSNEEGLVIDRCLNLEKSYHPGFDIDDTIKMFATKASKFKYPNDKLLERERVSPDGLILHPFDAEKKDTGWYVKVFEIFSRQYLEFHENDFVKFPLSTEEHLKERYLQINNN